ncbi:hypothetical protein ACHHRT_13190 [Desulfurivibrio sp. D14AmB]|uniref:hypothetical protein n=1 Tax=Desulfurivibrio sp. D14AmB TaxID=3374370 RepID=UPI00376F0552
MVPNFFKAQAAIDPDWALNNWARVKQIMLAQGALDRKTKELIAMAMELFTSFASIASSLEIPCDVTPAMVQK